MPGMTFGDRPRMASRSPSVPRSPCSRPVSTRCSAIRIRSRAMTRAAAGVADVASEAAAPIREPLALHLAGHPRDGRGWVLFARIEFDLDRFGSAAEAYRRALEASPKVARDPGVWCEYADALAMAQGGVLAGRPRELIERALAIDPGHARALEMAGSAAFEAGDFAEAARNWRLLLARLPDGTRAHRELELACSRPSGVRRSRREILQARAAAAIETLIPLHIPGLVRNVLSKLRGRIDPGRVVVPDPVFRGAGNSLFARTRAPLRRGSFCPSC